ncbi:MAG: hypothetical protein AAF495_04900 [Pseudomonadota bacterium]
MYAFNRHLRETIAVPALLAAAVLYSTPAAAKNVANDLDCVDCVQGPELEAGAVGPRELAPDAVFLTTILVRADGTPADNCTALLDALDETDIATESDPYLIKLEPGIYDCESTSVIWMNAYVDIEGSGQNTTIIRSERIPAIQVAANSELRQVTVEATGVDSARGIMMRRNNSRLANVTVIAEAEEADAIPKGISISPADERQVIEVDLDHVTVYAGTPATNGTAIQVIGHSNVRMTDVRAHGAQNGMTLITENNAKVIATGSVFEGSSKSVRVENTNEALLVTSLLIGPAFAGGGIVECIASYGPAFNVLTPACTP